MQLQNHRKIDRWYLAETLRKGEYSSIKKGYDRKDGKVVALKFISPTIAKGNCTMSKSKEIQNELEVLKQIKHSNILQLLEYDLNAQFPQNDGVIAPKILLVLEYSSGGQLFDILYFTKNISSTLNEKIMRTYFKQLIDGIDTLHEAGIYHRDIKAENLLLDSNYQLKIADAGLTKIFEKPDNAFIRTLHIGSLRYRSPEVLKKEEYTASCDIFSCGAILFILLAGYPAFDGATTKCKWYSPLTIGNVVKFWKQHRGCGIPSDAKDLLTRILWYDTNKRISIKGIKKHQWYNAETFNTKDLVSELYKLQHLMEIPRRQHAETQRRLKVGHAEWERGSQEICGIDFLQTMECRDYSFHEYVLIVCGFWRIINQQKIINIMPNDIILLIANILEDMDVWYYNAPSPMIVPHLASNECFTLKDVYTTATPRFVLQYIQKWVIYAGGIAHIDEINVSMEAHLAKKNLPDTISLQVRILRDNENNCFVVKFKRIDGDTLYFLRILKQLMRECGICLSGLPISQFSVSEQDRIDAETIYGEEFPDRQYWGVPDSMKQGFPEDNDYEDVKVKLCYPSTQNNEGQWVKLELDRKYLVIKIGNKEFEALKIDFMNRDNKMISVKEVNNDKIYKIVCKSDKQSKWLETYIKRFKRVALKKKNKQSKN